MSSIRIDSALAARLAVLQEFCDADALQNRIELVADVSDYLIAQFGEAGTEEKDRLYDWIVSLADLKGDLKAMRRARP